MMNGMSAAAPDAPTWLEPWSEDVGIARATALYQSNFGAAPTGVWSAPGRVNLIGEHTDYSGGLCLPTVLPHRTYVAASLRPDDRVVIVSERAEEFEGPGARWECHLDDITPDSAAGWPAYPAGVLWALRERGFDGRGLTIAITSCVPLGAGLASSAALTCAVAKAVNDLWRLSLDTRTGRSELADAAKDAENLVAGTPTGGLDHYAALFCAEGSAIEIDFATDPPGIRDTPLYFPDYGLVLLVVDTRKPHHLTDGKYAARYEECQRAAHALGAVNLRAVSDEPDGRQRVENLEDDTLKKRARHVVSEIARVREVSASLSDTGPAHERFIDVGRQIYRSHTSLAVDFEVSCDELDLAVNAAWTAGALGARLVGGGFGGSIIALVRRTQIHVTARIIDDAFAEAGFDRPHFLQL